MTQTYERLLKEPILSSLKKLIGASINSIYSNALAVLENHCESQLFIINIENGWLNITNKAQETPNDNDYYELYLTLTETPQDLTYDTHFDSIVYPFSIVKTNPRKIVSVEIFARKEKYNDEELFYDVAMLFTCEDDLRFIISLEERVDEFVIYSASEVIIEQYTADLSSRLLIK